MRRKDGLRKKRRQLWLEREKECSQNSQPMHDGKSPGPLASRLVLCNRKWACAVSAVCDEWQRGTHVDGKAMQPTTSATNRLQPQHTPLVMHSPSHTSFHTHRGAYTWLESGGVSGSPHKDDQHTMVSWQPLTSPTPLWCSTPSSNTSLLLSSWWCTGHTNTTLCTTSGLESVVLCMPCVAIPLLSLLSTPLPFSLCVSPALTLCQTHSPVNE